MVITFMLSVRIYPLIIYKLRKINLLDEQEDRSMHFTKTPTLGGVILCFLIIHYAICDVRWFRSTGFDRVFVAIGRYQDPFVFGG